jgi:MFS family permease
LGFFNCVQPIGQIASFPVEAWFSDRFGRKIGMLVGACIILSEFLVPLDATAGGLTFIVGCVLQGAAQNIGMFIAARFIIVRNRQARKNRS